MKTSVLAAALSAALITALPAEGADVKVISLPVYKPLFEKLGPEFNRATGHKIIFTSDLFSNLKARIDAEDFDVAISTATTTDYLAEHGKTVPATRVEFSRVGIGVGIAKGASRPDISSTEAFRQTLLATKSIAIPPTGSTAGAYLLRLFERIGVAESVKPKLTITNSGGQTPRAVATRQVEMGISLASEFAHFADIDLVGLIPSELQNYVVGTAAVGTSAKDPVAAEALVKYLVGAATPLLRDEGLGPPAR